MMWIILFAANVGSSVISTSYGNYGIAIFDAFVALYMLIEALRECGVPRDYRLRFDIASWLIGDRAFMKNVTLIGAYIYLDAETAKIEYCHFYECELGNFNLGNRFREKRLTWSDK